MVDVGSCRLAACARCPIRWALKTGVCLAATFACSPPSGTSSVKADGGASHANDETTSAPETENAILGWSVHFIPEDLEGAILDIVPRSEGILVTGTSPGSFEGETVNGDADAFLFEVDAEGELQWVTRWGTVGRDQPRQLLVHESGDLFVVGDTSGAFEGTLTGDIEAFATRFSPDGEELWTIQWGDDIWTTGGAAFDAAGNLLVVGHVAGAGGFVSHVTPDGEVLGTTLWEGEPGMDHQNVSIAPGATGLFVAGWTSGDDRDIFLTKLSPDDRVEWTRTWGTPGSDIGGDVVALESAIFVVGVMGTQLDTEAFDGSDAFITRYSEDGSRAWTYQWDTGEGERAWKATADTSGGLLVAGEVAVASEQLYPTTRPGGYLLRVSASGELDFDLQLSDGIFMHPTAIAAAPENEVLIGAKSSSGMQLMKLRLK